MTEPQGRWGSARRIVTGALGAWIAFAAVHLVLAEINLHDTVHLPFGDVVGVYRFWMDYAAANGVLVGIDTSWVYPVGALLPLGFAYLFGSDAYGVVWLVLVTMLDAVAFHALLRRRPAAAWWWVAFLAALGPVAVARLDSVTAPLAILGLLVLSARPVLAGALLGLGAWIKVWPAALLAAAVLTLRRRAAVFTGGALVTVAILGGALLLGAGAHVFTFISAQETRGLQVEAPVTSWWLWEAVLGLGGTRIYYDRDILTWQVLGNGTSAAAAAMTPLLVAAVAALLLLALRGMSRRVDPLALLPPLGLALVLAMIVFNKVGSPQYVAWLAAPVVLGLCLRQRAVHVPAALALGIALLTQVVYPWSYAKVIGADPGGAAVLTVRNLAFVVVLVLSVRILWLLPGRPDLDEDEESLFDEEPHDLMKEA
ncbi:glycosyltransferase 87 family protein [Naasia aerilata]|uniref:DUF2029 domain-containing protein n=1 Tax=Naasia aerilata TaxID=1162966 RepID=A0ABM8G7Z8_9MICO|nr:glycosyltransferase 87 family protein [Naasia aerilata]BDZ44289.1 hypothetical protein GCM10025866_01980 [Naasia aerilata]